MCSVPMSKLIHFSMFRAKGKQKGGFTWVLYIIDIFVATISYYHLFVESHGKKICKYLKKYVKLLYYLCYKFQLAPSLLCKKI